MSNPPKQAFSSAGQPATAGASLPIAASNCTALPSNRPVDFVRPERPLRRGRRSTVPPELREETRRIKKQNMERRRRACLSGKMLALHSVAMEIIGVNPSDPQFQRVEKADILNTCHRVLEGVSLIAKDDPRLQLCLRQLRSTFRTSSVSSSPKNNASQDSVSHPTDETPSMKTETNKENINYEPKPIIDSSFQLRSPTAINQAYWSNQSRSCNPNPIGQFPHERQPLTELPPLAQNRNDSGIAMDCSINTTPSPSHYPHPFSPLQPSQLTSRSFPTMLVGQQLGSPPRLPRLRISASPSLVCTPILTPLQRGHKSAFQRVGMGQQHVGKNKIANSSIGGDNAPTTSTSKSTSSSLWRPYAD